MTSLLRARVLLYLYALLVHMLVGGCGGSRHATKKPPVAIAQAPARESGRKSKAARTAKASKSKTKSSKTKVALGLSIPAAPLPPPLLFWQVSRQGRPGSAFLLGSIHMAQGGHPHLDEAVEEAWLGSSAVVVEVDITAEGTPPMQELARQYGLLGKGETLEDRLSPQTLALLGPALAKSELTPEAARHSQPWAIYLTLESARLRKWGFDPDFGVDRHFLERARYERPLREIIALETAESQIKLLAGMPADVQDLMLRDVLSEDSQARKSFEALIDAWQRGDGATIERLIYQPAREHPESKPLIDHVFVDRNLSMSERLDRVLKNPGTYFVVVGVGHLVGDSGMPAILAKMGYQVEQVRKGGVKPTDP